MKPIELTKEHKSKLLEMCNKLFFNGCMNENDFDEEDKLFILKKKATIYQRNILHIHWFEFCMIHLAEKILNNSYGDISTSELGYFSCGPIKEIHPVDYLYEEFKKLEKDGK